MAVVGLRGHVSGEDDASLADHGLGVVALHERAAVAHDPALGIGHVAPSGQQLALLGRLRATPAEPLAGPGLMLGAVGQALLVLSLPGGLLGLQLGWT